MRARAVINQRAAMFTVLVVFIEQRSAALFVLPQSGQQLLTQDAENGAGQQFDDHRVDPKVNADQKSAAGAA
jgi:hypothetical protein